MQRKRTTRVKTTKSRNPRRSKPSLIKPLSILFLLIALCVGAYWNLNGGSVSEKMADTKMSEIEGGKSSGKDMDYTDASKELQDAVDVWLKGQGASLTILDTAKRQEDRRATQGNIYWTVHKVRVVPAKEFSRSALEAELAKSSGKAVLYNVEKTKLDGKEVTEYDIALYDTLDKEPLYMVCERLYVTEPGAAPGLLDKVKSLILGKTTAPEKDAVKSSQPKQEKSESSVSHPSQVKGRLAIVIDDFGYRRTALDSFNPIPVPLTYAVIPNREYTQDCAESGYNAGRQIFVHVPMQPLNTSSSEPVYISPDMTAGKVKSTAAALLNQVPHAIGVNNHQGSSATASGDTMRPFMDVLRQRDLIFLDSRTNSASVAAQTASAMGVANGRNSLFIDNDDDVSSIKSRLRQAGQIAVNNGSCIVIGHCRPNTAEAIRSMVDELHQDGVDIVFASQLMQ